MRIHILTNQEFTDVYKYSTEVTIHFGDDNTFLFLKGAQTATIIFENGYLQVDGYGTYRFDGEVCLDHEGDGVHFIATGTDLVFIKEDRWSFTASSETYELMFSALTSAAEMIEENNWKVEELSRNLRPVFNAYKILDKFFNQ
jgi:hypothetical protein